MARKIPIYPSWGEIKNEVSKCDLLSLITDCLDNDVDLEEGIDIFIKENYEPIRYEVDEDEAYEEMLERKYNKGDDNE